MVNKDQIAWPHVGNAKTELAARRYEEPSFGQKMIGNKAVYSIVQRHERLTDFYQFRKLFGRFA